MTVNYDPGIKPADLLSEGGELVKVHGPGRKPAELGITVPADYLPIE